MKIAKIAREFAIAHRIRLGLDSQGYFIAEGDKVVERPYNPENARTARGALVMMRRYLKRAGSNPVPDSSAKKGRKARVNQAERLFEDFSGHFPGKQFKIPVPDDDVALAFGKVIAIQYETVRDGKRELYQHDFRSKSRPLLAASSDGYQLYLLGGKYQFTDRGIVDK